MLRHEMVTEAQALLEDPDYWTAARLTTLFNRGMRDIANKFGIAVSGYFIFQSVQAQQQYMVPHDFTANELISFEANGTTNNITIKPRPASVYGVVYDPDQEGTPDTGFFWAKEDREELWIYPTFDADGISINWFYWRRPPNITLDNDEPLIPRDWHTYLVDYAVYYTHVQDQEKGWNFTVFYGWWESVKVGIQVAEAQKDMASRDIRMGIFDDQLPRVNDANAMVRTPDEW